MEPWTVPPQAERVLSWYQMCVGTVIKSFMMRNYNVVLDTVQRPHWTKSAAKKSKKPHAHAQNTKDASREEVGRRVAADVFDYLRLERGRRFQTRRVR